MKQRGERTSRKMEELRRRVWTVDEEDRLVRAALKKCDPPVDGGGEGADVGANADLERLGATPGVISIADDDALRVISELRRLRDRNAYLESNLRESIDTLRVQHDAERRQWREQARSQEQDDDSEAEATPRRRWGEADAGLEAAFGHQETDHRFREEQDDDENEGGGVEEGPETVYEEEERLSFGAGGEVEEDDGDSGIIELRYDATEAAGSQPVFLPRSRSNSPTRGQGVTTASAEREEKKRLRRQQEEQRKSELAGLQRLQDRGRRVEYRSCAGGSGGVTSAKRRPRPQSASSAVHSPVGTWRSREGGRWAVNPASSGGFVINGRECGGAAVGKENRRRVPRPQSARAIGVAAAGRLRPSSASARRTSAFQYALRATRPCAQSPLKGKPTDGELVVGKTTGLHARASADNLQGSASAPVLQAV